MYGSIPSHQITLPPFLFLPTMASRSQSLPLVNQSPQAGLQNQPPPAGQNQLPPPPPPSPYCIRLSDANVKDLLKNPPRFIIHFGFGLIWYFLTTGKHPKPYIAIAVVVAYGIYCALPTLIGCLFPGNTPRWEILKATVSPYHRETRVLPP